MTTYILRCSSFFDWNSLSNNTVCLDFYITLEFHSAVLISYTLQSGEKIEHVSFCFPNHTLKACLAFIKNNKKKCKIPFGLTWQLCPALILGISACKGRCASGHAVTQGTAWCFSSLGAFQRRKGPGRDFCISVILSQDSGGKASPVKERNCLLGGRLFSRWNVLILSYGSPEFMLSWAVSDLIQGSTVSAKIIVSGEKKDFCILKYGSQYIV